MLNLFNTTLVSERDFYGCNPKGKFDVKCHHLIPGILKLLPSSEAKLFSPAANQTACISSQSNKSIYFADKWDGGRQTRRSDCLGNETTSVRQGFELEKRGI